MAELIVIKPEHPFSGKELFFLAVSLGVLAWIGPFAADFALAHAPRLSYQGSGVERTVKDLGRPVLMGLGAAVLGVCAPSRGWLMAPIVALADVFLWIVRAWLAAGQSDLGRIEALGPALLRILALTVLPAAVTGAIMSTVKD